MAQPENDRGLYDVESQIINYHLKTMYSNNELLTANLCISIFYKNISELQLHLDDSDFKKGKLN